MRILQIIALCFLVCLCTCKNASQTEHAPTGPIERYQLHGQIVQLDSANYIARIKHQKIEGWMEAMTMEFPVKDQTEFQALHTGDEIAATVFVQGTQYWIGDIRHEIVK
jgi:protein SCO1/2